MSFPNGESDDCSTDSEVKNDDRQFAFPLSPDTLAARNDPNLQIQTALLWNRSGAINSDQEACVDGNEDGAKIAARHDGTNSQADDIDFDDLKLHRDRLAAAAEQLGWTMPACLKRNEAALSLIRQHIRTHIDQLPSLQSKHIEQRKVRILISAEGNVAVESIPIGITTSVSENRLSMRPFIPLSLDETYESTNELCRVHLDLQPSSPSVLTTHKTTYRFVYESARSRVNLSPKTPPTTAEVLLHNSAGEIFDASACTVYFKRDGHWITPAATCGPTLGVTRRVAIHNGLCKEGIIKPGSLVFNETLWLSNAVRGFFKGILAINP